MMHDNGFFYFKFSSKEGMDRILEEEDGISLIATKLGKPIMLDAYTNTMCLESWGRSSYARALIKITSDHDFKEKLIMVVPMANGAGHKMARTNKRKENDKDGFVTVTHKGGKAKEGSKQQAHRINGLKLNKPKPSYYYRLIHNTTKSHSNEASSSEPVIIKNSFDALNKNEESDNKEVNDVYDESVSHSDRTESKGTSTPLKEVSNV
ncbi:hypothetical protein Tco_1425409, partial [Tanacetum coccineum]